MPEASKPRPRAVAIVGPTAAGKSALALRLAERLARPILCCDSVQVYRGLDIGSAKPSAEDRRRVPHHLLDLVDPDQPFTAGDYGRLARARLAEGPAIICGGTGLYLRTTAWSQSGSGAESGSGSGAGTVARRDDRGPAREAFEREWRAREASEAGAIWGELARRDPDTAGQVHARNIVRALRALWLCELHGEPVSAVRRRDPPRQLVDLFVVVVDPGVAAVDAAIEARCADMLARGWLAEVEKLRARGYASRHKAMQSLGYRELLAHLRGESTLAAATEAIVRATRRYARRQRTYFRHQLGGIPPEQTMHIDHPDACPPARLAAFLAGGPGGPA